MSKQGWPSKMDKGWPLPEDHLPEGRVCVQFEIPDDQTYAATVIGLIMDLGKWWNWEKGGGLDRRATETAQFFRTAIHETLCVEKYREMGCKCEDQALWLHRFAPDGTMEVSKNGGLTWQADPSDPRITAPQLPLLPGNASLEKKCAAANNVEAHIKEKADQLAADAELWSGIQTMIAALIGLLLFLEIIGTGGALTPIVLAFGGALLAGGRAAFIAAMTEDVWDQFRCMVYFNLTGDGVLKSGGLEAIKSKVHSDFTGIAVTFFDYTLNLLGEIGINNIAKTGSGSAEPCDECCPTISVYRMDEGGVSEPVLYEPDELGYYTIPMTYYHSGGGYDGYQTNICFTSNKDLPPGSPVSLIEDVTFPTGSGTFAFRINADRVLVFDWGIAMLFAYRSGVPSSIKFKLAGT